MSKTQNGYGMIWQVGKKVNMNNTQIGSMEFSGNKCFFTCLINLVLDECQEKRNKKRKLTKTNV